MGYTETDPDIFTYLVSRFKEKISLQTRGKMISKNDKGLIAHSYLNIPG